MAETADAGRRRLVGVFAREFAALINAGVSLVRSLQALGEATPDPQFAAVVGDLQARLEGGETLSQAMHAQPEWFSPLAISMVRAGEVGGVLDETMERWADMLDRDEAFREKLQLYQLLARVAEAVGGTPAGQWEARIRHVLEASRDRANASIFCANLGMMLGSGVPVLQALSVAAEVLTEEARNCVNEARESIRGGETIWGPMQRAPGLTPVVGWLLRVGEETGTLDTMSFRAGELLRVEVERELQEVIASALGRAEDPE